MPMREIPTQQFQDTALRSMDVFAGRVQQAGSRELFKPNQDHVPSPHYDMARYNIGIEATLATQHFFEVNPDDKRLANQSGLRVTAAVPVKDGTAHFPGIVLKTNDGIPRLGLLLGQDSIAPHDYNRHIQNPLSDMQQNFLGMIWSLQQPDVISHTIDPTTATQSRVNTGNIGEAVAIGTTTELATSLHSLAHRQVASGLAVAMGKREALTIHFGANNNDRRQGSPAVILAADAVGITVSREHQVPDITGLDVTTLAVGGTMAAIASQARPQPNLARNAERLVAERLDGNGNAI